MGYCIDLLESTWTIRGNKLKDAYQAMVALNTTHDHLKHGGSWSGGKQTAKWFSWMDADYPAKCLDARAILEHLRFECEDGEISVVAGAANDRAEKIKKLRANAHGTTNPDEAHAFLAKANELEALPPVVNPNAIPDLKIMWFNGEKVGQEDLFLEAIAPFSTGFLHWLGEDGAQWKNEVRDGKMVTLDGKVSFG